jgi:bifunctional DNA-binding transcriptional regulator/antitoxin component of YhaV-PrlF toxin-antitoxin module
LPVTIGVMTPTLRPVTMTKTNRITVPSWVRKHLIVQPGDELDWVQTKLGWGLVTVESAKTMNTEGKRAPCSNSTS